MDNRLGVEGHTRRIVSQAGALDSSRAGDGGCGQHPRPRPAREGNDICHVEVLIFFTMLHRSILIHLDRGRSFAS